MKKLLFLSLIVCNLCPMKRKQDFGEITVGNSRRFQFLECVRNRIARNQDLNQPEAGLCLPPLQYFVYHGDKEIDTIRELLAHGAFPSIKDVNGIMPLHTATRHCSVATIQELLNYHANPNAISKIGLTPLYQVCVPENDRPPRAKNRLSAALLLLKKGADPNILRSRAPIHLLIAKNFYMNSLENFNPFKNEKMRINFIKNRKNMIKLLIRYGCYIYQKLDPNKNAIETAHASKNPNLIELANFAEREYIHWQLLFCRKRPSWIQRIPRDLLRYIANLAA